MKKSLFIGILMAFHIGVASAEHIDSIDTSVDWHVSALIRVIYNNYDDDKIYDEMTALMEAETGDCCRASPKQICDIYIRAVKNTGSAAIACSGFVEELIKRHNALLKSISNLTPDVSLSDRNTPIQWYESSVVTACQEYEDFMKGDRCSVFSFDTDLDGQKYSINDIKKICVTKAFQNNDAKCELLIQKAVERHNWHVDYGLKFNTITQTDGALNALNDIPQEKSSLADRVCKLSVIGFNRAIIVRQLITKTQNMTVNMSHEDALKVHALTMSNRIKIYQLSDGKYEVTWDEEYCRQILGGD